MFLSTDQITLDQLPNKLQNIAEMIGLTASIKLIEHYGGTSLLIPKRIDESHYLVKSLGVEAAFRLSDYYGRETLYIPKADQIMRKMRNRQIIKDFDSGISVKQLARKYRLSNRRIHSILTESYV